MSLLRSGGSRCLEFFFALVSTQQKSFNAGSKLPVDTTVNKRVKERITLSKKENNMINFAKCGKVTNTSGINRKAKKNFERTIASKD